ncbi:MAG: MEMO1 family protein [Clostridia bacterium]|nr:MEMO1 family protein [Clostridia bacterium]
MSETYEKGKAVLACGAVSPHPPILLPGVGGGREKGAEATRAGMEKLAARIAARRPAVIVCITPHGPAYRDALAVTDGVALAGDMSAFGVPGLRMEIEVDRALTRSVIVNLEEAGIPVAIRTADEPGRRGRPDGGCLDHGCLVPLYFIRQALTEFRIVHVSAGFLSTKSHRIAGAAIRKAVDRTGSDAILLASGDMSHVLRWDGPYGFHPDGPVFDREVEDILRSGELLRLIDMDPVMVENAAQCGLRPLCALAGYLGGSATAEVFSHEGPFGVGYLTAYLCEKGRDAE